MKHFGEEWSEMTPKVAKIDDFSYFLSSKPPIPVRTLDQSKPIPTVPVRTLN